MLNRFWILIITLNLISQMTLSASPFMCRLALNDFSAQIAIDEVNQRNNSVLFPAMSSLTAYKQAKLFHYITQLDIRNLVTQQSSAQIAETILRIIEGDKFSVTQKWLMNNETYRWRKQQQIIREAIFEKGLNNVFAEIGFRSPSFREQLRLRVHSILNNTGLRWAIARLNFSALDYKSIPTELSSGVILDGWEVHRDAIESFFSQQSKRHLFNTWHKELGLILAGILTLTTYFSFYDQTLIHYQNFEQTQITQMQEFEQTLQWQRNHVENLSTRENAVLKQLESSIEQQMNSQDSGDNTGPRQLSNQNRAQLRELFIDERPSTSP